MSKANNSISPSRSDEDLARMVISLAEATPVDSIICITETGMLAQHLYRLSGQFRVIATTTNGDTFDTLTKAGMEVIRLPLHTADKYTQIRHAISVVLQSSSISKMLWKPLMDCPLISVIGHRSMWSPRSLLIDIRRNLFGADDSLQELSIPTLIYKTEY